MDHSYLKFEQIGMSFRRGQMATRSAARHRPHHRPGRVRLHDRPFRLRQVDLAQHPGRPPEVDHRRGLPRRQGGRRAGPRPRHRLPEPFAAAVAHRLRQRRHRRRQGVRLVQDQGRAPRLGDAQSRAGADGAGQGQAPARGLRRHEAARRHRPRARHAAQGAADGRAVRRARCADPRPSAGQRHGDPCAPRQHGDDDHPRRRRGGAAVGSRGDDDQRSVGHHRRDPEGAPGAAAPPARARDRRRVRPLSRRRARIPLRPASRAGARLAA